MARCPAFRRICRVDADLSSRLIEDALYSLAQKFCLPTPSRAPLTHASSLIF
jgi:hypothetical protein